MKLTAYQGSPFTFTTGDKYIVQQRNAGHEGVMGYFRPVSGYNKGKQSEFNERKWFVESKAYAANASRTASSYPLSLPSSK